MLLLQAPAGLHRLRPTAATYTLALSSIAAAAAAAIVTITVIPRVDDTPSDKHNGK